MKLEYKTESTKPKRKHKSLTDFFLLGFVLFAEFLYTVTHFNSRIIFHLTTDVK